MMKLHVIQAQFGDSMLVEFGHPVKYILIDGGPAGVYNASLRKELVRLVSTAVLEAIIITHVDADHIKGILDLLAEVKSDIDTGNPPFVQIKELWMNSFSQTIDPDNVISNGINEVFSIAGQQGINMATTDIAVNGIKQGDQITRLCTMLNIPMNTAADNGIFLARQPATPILVDNVSLTITGPTQQNLDNLKQEWEEWLEHRHQEVASMEILAMSDKSIPNLSSLMFYLEADGRTFLFTGDGRGDHLLDGLKKTSLLTNGKIHVNVLKVPHHGSDRNVTRGFFETVTADTYIISANGKHSNPDYSTLTWIVDAAKLQQRQVKLMITNKTEASEKLLRDYDTISYGYELQFIEYGALSMQL